MEFDLKSLQTHLHSLRPDFTSKLVHVLAFGTPKFYIAPYDKIKHELVNLSSNCDVKSGLRLSLLTLSTNYIHIRHFLPQRNVRAKVIVLFIIDQPSYIRYELSNI